MARAKVSGRSKGLQPGKRCTACNLEGHRLETCSSKAAVLIRRLKHQLAAQKGKAGTSRKAAKIKRDFRSERKDNKRKKVAKLAYPGKAAKDHGSKQLRGSRTRTRELVLANWSLADDQIKATSEECLVLCWFGVGVH